MHFFISSRYNCIKFQCVELDDPALRFDLNKCESVELSTKELEEQSELCVRYKC